jgi:hypothetical protein
MPSKPGTNFGPFKLKLNLHTISAHDFIQSYSHALDYPAMHEQFERFDLSDKSEVDDDPLESSDTRLVNAATSSIATKLPPGDIQ